MTSPPSGYFLCHVEIMVRDTQDNEPNPWSSIGLQAALIVNKLRLQAQLTDTNEKQNEESSSDTNPRSADEKRSDGNGRYVDKGPVPISTRVKVFAGK
jgi:hypothetical protein